MPLQSLDFVLSSDMGRSSLSVPSTFRNPREYFRIFDSVETREKDGRYAHYELLSCKPVDAYCRIKKNQNQVRLLPQATHPLAHAQMIYQD